MAGTPADAPGSTGIRRPARPHAAFWRFGGDVGHYSVSRQLPTTPRGINAVEDAVEKSAHRAFGSWLHLPVRTRGGAQRLKFEQYYDYSAPVWLGVCPRPTFPCRCGVCTSAAISRRRRWAYQGALRRTPTFPVRRNDSSTAHYLRRSAPPCSSVDRRLARKLVSCRGYVMISSIIW